MATRATDKADPLNDRQRAFVESYLVHLNATKAAEDAGYSAKTAREQGARLLTNVAITAEIKRRQAERAEKAKLTADEVLQEIDTLASSDIGKVFDLNADTLRLLPMREWPEEARRAVASVKVKQYPVKDLPPLTSDDWDKLEAIATGKAYHFNISRAILPEDQAFMLGLIERMREVYYTQYEIVELKLWDKNSALDKAAKHRGLIGEKGMTPDEIRERNAKQIDALTAALPPQEAEKAIAAIRRVWLAA